MAAVAVFLATSAALTVCLAVAVFNVVLRRENASVVQYQIHTLLLTGRQAAVTMLGHVGGCTPAEVSSAQLRLVADSIASIFPESRVSLQISAAPMRPAWLHEREFSGPVVDHGSLEVREFVTAERDGCVVTSIVSLPIGSAMAQRLSLGRGLELSAVPARPFRVHPLHRRIISTLEANFVPNSSRPVSVVLSARNWQTGVPEDWVAFELRPHVSWMLEDISHLGEQRADWVWLILLFSTGVVMFYLTGAWVSGRFLRGVTNTVNSLSVAARHIGMGDFSLRIPAPPSDQLGDLARDFNSMAVSLERLHKEEQIKQRLDSEIEMGWSIQMHLYPPAAFTFRDVTVAGRTSPARVVGGDLYDFFNIDSDCMGILCADISGKGVPAALMMANVQAIANACRIRVSGSGTSRPAEFVCMLNREMVGRFGDNRYATAFWAEYDSRSRRLRYVNAGNLPPVLIRSNGQISRLESDGFPVGMFADVQYTTREVLVDRGDRLLIFSDGLTDAQNSDEEAFGDDRVIEFCRSIAASATPVELVDELMGTVGKWSRGVEQFDDITVVFMAVA